MLDPVEYVIGIRTGEVLQVSEFDPERIPALADPEVLRLADPVLSLCTRIGRQDLSDAKAGDTRALEDALRAPPEGCLLKLVRPVCRHVPGGSCSMADARRCSASGRSRGRPDFPVCWEFLTDSSRDAHAVSDASYLASRIVSAWRELRHVLLVR